jgi:protein-S-isoprenylcysteine O-methyltransferase Ste14
MASRSPWWYRRRGTVIGAIYAWGFLAGYAIPGPHRPAFEAWGDRFAGGAGSSSILIWSAVACAMIAWLLRAAGTAYLGRSVVFADDVQQDALIVAGPFRYVRNPLYLGNIFLTLAVALLAPPIGFALIVAGKIAFVWLLAAEESRRLAARYGSTYQAYRAAVPAFLPRFTPAGIQGTATRKPSWGAALFSEAAALAFAIALVPIALFGGRGATAFWAIWLSALVFFGLIGRRASRSRPAGKGGAGKSAL